MGEILCLEGEEERVERRSGMRERGRIGSGDDRKGMMEREERALGQLSGKSGRARIGVQFREMIKEFKRENKMKKGKGCAGKLSLERGTF